MKTDTLLEDIKSRLDIIDLISDYVELKKAGQNYRANCPFHVEKTPSFMVSPSKQIFHCFGCGAGGDILGFVMKYENMTFQETVKLLAKKAGIKLSGYKFDSDLAEKKEKLSALQNEALSLFRENLKGSKEARSYLVKRGLKQETVEAFSLGYAPKEWRNLYEHLKSKGYEDSMILQAGLVASGEDRPYDIFRSRIIFPIFNIHGDAVAFGGRAMDDSMPKYLNSPETLLFKKGETLYGLHIAKDEIRKKDYAMVVEGYMDVIMCYQHGFTNVVAPLGTALTPGHLNKLGRFTKKVLLLFDGDDAGIAAAKRSLVLLYEYGFRSKVLILPEQDDPDSFLRKHGSDAFRLRLPKAKSMIDFILGLSSDKVDNIRTAIGIIDNAKDLILREELFKELAQKSGIKESIIRREAKKEEKTVQEKSLQNTSKHASLPYNEDVLLLSAIVSFPDKASYVFDNLRVENLHNPAVRKIFDEIRPLADKLNINNMLSVLSDEEKSLVAKLSLHPGFDVEKVDKNIRDCLRKMAYHEIDAKIGEAKSAGNLKLLSTLLAEKQKIGRGKDDRTP
ncbi:MAG: DNA primase [Nitrospirae bacterium]|nr:DNA primase [Nitrospirota bacterium]